MHHRIAAAAAPLALAVLLVGCASVDPKPDLAETEAAVERRLSVDLDWSRDWSTPLSPAWDGREPLSADRAVAVALERNRDLRLALVRIASARADLAEATNPPEPRLAFAYEFPLAGYGNSMIWATAMQQVNWLWTRGDAIDAADAGRRAAILDAAAEAVRIALAVRAAHAELALAEETAREADERIAAVELASRTRAAAIGAGLEAPNAAAVNAALAAEAAEAGAVADASVRQAKISLLALLGLSEASLDFTSDGRLPELSMPAGLDDARVAAIARTRRLDLGAAEARFGAAVAEARLAGLEALPDVELGASYDRDLEGRDGLGPVIETTLPIFGRIDVAKARAEIRLAQGRLELDRARQSGVAEARKALAAWQAADAALRPSANRRAAELAIESTLRGRLDAGLVSPAELAEATRRRTLATIESADVRRAELVARFALLAALGGGWDPPPLPELARAEGGSR